MTFSAKTKERTFKIGQILSCHRNIMSPLRTQWQQLLLLKRLPDSNRGIYIHNNQHILIGGSLECPCYALRREMRLDWLDSPGSAAGVCVRFPWQPGFWFKGFQTTQQSIISLPLDNNVLQVLAIVFAVAIIFMFKPLWSIDFLFAQKYCDFNQRIGMKAGQFIWCNHFNLLEQFSISPYICCC